MLERAYYIAHLGTEQSRIWLFHRHFLGVRSSISCYGSFGASWFFCANWFF